MIHSLVRKDIFTEIKQLIFLLEIDRYFIDPSKGKFFGTQQHVQGRK